MAAFDADGADGRERERLHRLAAEVTARPGFTSGIGVELVSVEKGAVVMALARRADLLQAHGQFHGGVIAALADHAAGGAVTTALPPGRFAITVDLHVHYLAPATGPRLTARARAVQVGGTIGVAQVELFTGEDGAEKACAIATVTLRAVAMPAPPAPAAEG